MDSKSQRMTWVGAIVFSVIVLAAGVMTVVDLRSGIPLSVLGVMYAIGALVGVAIFLTQRRFAAKPPRSRWTPHLVNFGWGLVVSLLAVAVLLVHWWPELSHLK